MKALVPYKLVASVGEWYRSDFSMLSPCRTFGADHILTKEVDSLVNLDGFWKVVSSGGYLHNGVGIGDVDQCIARTDYDERVRASLCKRSVSVCPRPIDAEKAAMRLDISWWTGGASNIRDPRMRPAMR